jgi:glutamate synthase (NADPH) large chain
LAQPFRFLCHNGEINTVRGNTNWMNARQYLFQNRPSATHPSKLFPIIHAGRERLRHALDNALELLYHTGRDCPTP